MHTRALEMAAESDQSPRSHMVDGACSSLASFNPGLYGCQLVTESVEAACRSSSQAVALVDVTTPATPLHLSYQQLWGASSDIAQAVQAATLAQGLQTAAAPDGVVESSCGRQPVVGVLVGRSWRLVAALLGVLRAGAAYVPLDPEYPPQRLATYCKEAQVDLVLTDSSSEGARGAWDSMLQELHGSSPPQVLDITTLHPAGTACHGCTLLSAAAGSSSSSAISPGPQALPPVSITGDTTAYILFTSGSTGTPKGVAVSHRALAQFLSCHLDLWGFSSADTAVLTTSICFDPHVTQVFGPLMVGAKLVVPPQGLQANAGAMIRLIAAEGITFLHTVPTLAWLYFKHPQAASMSSLRLIRLGGEVLTPELAATVYHTLPDVQLVNVYGPTEATVSITSYALPRSLYTSSSNAEDKDGPGPVPIGAPEANVAVYVVDPDQRNLLQPLGVPGELLIAGPRLAQGYVQPGVGTDRWIPNPFLEQPGAAQLCRQLYATCYCTGDRVVLGADGLLHYCGRLDRQVKLNGVRIELGEVEAAVAAAPGVEHCVAAALQQHPPHSPKLLLAFVRPATACPKAVLAFCQAQLPTAMWPYAVVPVDAFERLPNGKVDHGKPPPVDWAKLLEAAEPGESGYVAPANDLEQELQRVWKQVLNLSFEPSTTADFFALGGSSLTAMVVAAAFSETHALSPLLIHTTRTIQATAAALMEEEEPGMPPSTPQGHAPWPGGWRSSSPTDTATTSISSPSTCGSSSGGSNELVAREWPSSCRPVGAAMEQMWVLQQMLEAGSVAYNEPIATYIPQDLSQQQLEACIRLLVERHEALRCRIVMGAPPEEARGEAAAGGVGAAAASRPAGSSLVAEVLPAGEVPLEDLLGGAWLECGDPEALLPLLVECARCQLDLSQGPLLRVAVVRLGWPGAPAPLVVMLTMHHAIVDGWAMSVLVKELRAACSVVAAGGLQQLPAALAPLPCGLFDYMAWQLERRGSLQYQRGVEYWVGQVHEALAAGADALKLPGEDPHHASTASGSSRGGAVITHLPEELLGLLRGLTSQLRSSMHNLLLAGFLALLARVGFAAQPIADGAEEEGAVSLILGVPFAGREHPASQQLVGNLINVMALAAKVQSSGSLAQLVEEVNARMLGAMTHGYVALQDVTQALRQHQQQQVAAAAAGPEGSTWVGKAAAGATPFRVMFAAQNDNLDGCIQPDLGISKLDLTLSFLGTELHWEFKEGLLEAGSVQRLAEQYVHLLQAMASNPGAPICSLPLLPEAQVAQLLQYSLGPERPEYSQQPLLPAAVAARAAAAPGAIALLCDASGGRPVSYGALQKGVMALAAELLAMPATGQGQPVVGVLVGRSWRLVAALLGVLRTGAAYVPLDPEYPPQRLATYCREAKVDLVLVDESGAEAWREVQQQLLLLEKGDVAGSGWQQPQVLMVDGLLDAALLQPPGLTPAALPAVDPDSTAYIMFTSGSTGTPKGVRISHRGLRDMLCWTRDHYQLGPHTTSLFTCSVSFDPHVHQLFGPLLAGGTVVVARPGVQTDSTAVGQLISGHHVNFFDSVPSLCALYFQDPGFIAAAAPSLRTLTLGGEALTPALAANIQQALPGVAVYNVYGPTEATVNCISCCVTALGEGSAPRAVPIGAPEANVAVYVVDPHQRNLLQPLGVPGELLIAGPRLAQGYVQPGVGADRWIPNPFLEQPDSAQLCPQLYATCYCTGDRVVLGADGLLHYCGRLDRQVKVNGVRIELGEVEAAVAAAPGVESAVVLATQDSSGHNKCLVAYFSPANVDPASVRLHCSSMLPSAAVPAAFVPISRFRTTATGKIDTSSLPQEFSKTLSKTVNSPAAAAASAETSRAQATTPLQRQLLQVWADVLGLPEDAVDIGSSFFQQGGNSLKAGLLMVKLRQELQLPDLPATLVYQHANLAAMASYMEQRQQEKQHQRGPAAAAVIAAAPSGTFVDCGTFLEDVATLSSSSGGDGGSSDSSSQDAGCRQLPYPMYLLLQYLLCCLGYIIPCIRFTGALIAFTFVLRSGLAVRSLAWLWYALAMPWLTLALSAATVLLLVGFKWVVVGKLRPGRYPLYGVMHLRVIATGLVTKLAREQVQGLLQRSEGLVWIYRLLGARMGRGIILDTGAGLQVPELATVGDGSALGMSVLLASFSVHPGAPNQAPADKDGPQPQLDDGSNTCCPMLILEEAHVGQGCDVGPQAVLPCGCYLADGRVVAAGEVLPQQACTKPPETSPSSSSPPGKALGPAAGAAAPKAQQQQDPWLQAERPFYAERFMSRGDVAGLLVSSMLLDVLLAYPGTFFLYWVLQVISGGRRVDAAAHATTNSWSYVTVLVCGLVLSQTVVSLINAAISAAFLAGYKRWVVGRLGPGLRLTDCPRRLFRYALYQRLLEGPACALALHLIDGTWLQRQLLRFMGLRLGRGCYLSDINMLELDAISLGDRLACGSYACVRCADAGGVVRPVVVEDDVILGNASVLLPGSRVGHHAVVGNDTTVHHGVRVPPHERRQGEMAYTIPSAFSSPSWEDPCNNKDTAAAGAGSASRAAAALTSAAQGLEQVLQVGAEVLLRPLPLLLTWSVVLGLMGVSARWVGPYWVMLGYPLLLPPGFVALVGLMRLAPWVLGMRAAWAQGRTSIANPRWRIYQGMCTSASTTLEFLGHTPFMALAWRLIGHRVGRGAMLNALLPAEAGLVDVGSGAVIEEWVVCGAHFLDAAGFVKFMPVRIGDHAWLQHSSRVMPGTSLSSGARLLHGSMLLPGEHMDAGACWAGRPANPTACI